MKQLEIAFSWQLPKWVYNKAKREVRIFPERSLMSIDGGPWEPIK